MDKKFISIDNQKKYFKVFNVVCIALLFTIIIIAAFGTLLPKWFTSVCFWCYIVFFVSFIVADILFYNKIKTNIKKVLKSKYLFDRNAMPERIETNYKDCILQEVEFFEDGFVLNGVKVPYNEVKFEYSIYGDNIMFHIYVKDEEVSPLLVFIVTQDMYYMIKKFNLNVDMIDKEINVLNLNNN